MPAPLDLIGRRFGRLQVLEAAAPVVSSSGKTKFPAWRCLCDCGREEVVIAKRLPYVPSNAARADVVTECAHCRSQRTCEVCGKAFVSAQFRKTCSGECAVLLRRANDMNYYFRQVAIDPDRSRKIKADRRARAQCDPEYAQRLAGQLSQQDSRKRALIRSDPERKAHYAEMARQRYANDPGAQAKKRAARDARIAAMTPEQYEDWAERVRDSWRRSAAKVRGTPEGRQRYREYMREYLRQQALRGLAGVGDELVKRSLSDE